MSKPVKKRFVERKAADAQATLLQSKANDSEPANPHRQTKQSRVIGMLRSNRGASIPALMQATGWKQHSVRGFLAAVVRKRLKLRLDSRKVDGGRIYRIVGGSGGKSGMSASNKQPS